MIGAFVTFRYPGNFDANAVRRIAETARTRFEGMAGLRSKAFTVNPDLRERVAGLYGVAPSIELVEIAALVENRRS